MKFIKAYKCADGWYVQLTHTFSFPTEQEVREFIQEEELAITIKGDNIIEAYKPLEHKRQSDK